MPDMSMLESILTFVHQESNQREDKYDDGHNRLETQTYIVYIIREWHIMQCQYG